MTTLLGKFRGGGTPRLNRFHRHVSGKLEYAGAEKKFAKMKKENICLQQFWRCVQDFSIVVPNLSEVTRKYPTTESLLDRNYTYLSSSHHDVYLVQFSNYYKICSSHYFVQLQRW